MRPKLLQQFLDLESASGIILFSMAVIAMIWANSGIADWHQEFIRTFLFTINDGLMAVFFLVVGLELKRGYLAGQLSGSAVVLPLAAAVGGMLVPALLYIMINYHHPITLKGWSTPVATDIAFALAVLTFFGKRISPHLKLFLLALAIFDDLGAILIIALFYTTHLLFNYFFLAAFIFFCLCWMNRSGVRTLAYYLLLGVILWWSLWQAGVHPTIAGVLLAFTIPGERLERVLHPYVAFLIMPLFALANAGFSLEGLSWETGFKPTVLGIVVGLFIGKQVGVFGFAWGLIRFFRVKMPKGTTWLALYGTALLCGIGFTMSLFLGTLSFQYDDVAYLVEVRLGVIIGSILSGIGGFFVLKGAYR